MRELDRVEDRIRQHRQVVADPLIIVEGPDDLLVLRGHVPADRIFPADGKSNLLRAMRALAEWGESDVTAVADADFDDPAAVVDLGSSLVLYERRDLEAMLILLGVLTTVIEHQGSAEKIAASGDAESVVDQLEAAVSPVTALRSANARNSWGLAFDEVSIASKADRGTLAVAVARYCQAVVQASDTSVTLGEVIEAAAQEVGDDLGPRGRDVIELAGLALRQKIGTLPQAATLEGTLTAQLHSSAGLALSRSEWLGRLQATLALAPGASAPTR
jgi:hypothetical protein